MTLGPLFPSQGPGPGVQTCRLQPASLLPRSPILQLGSKGPDLTPTAGLPFWLWPSLSPAPGPGWPASRSGPLPCPTTALDYLTSGGCSAFSAVLSRRSMALPAASRSSQTDRVRRPLLTGSAWRGSRSPRRKCRRAPSGGTQRAGVAHSDDARGGGRRHPRDLPAGAPRRAPRWGRPVVEEHPRRVS